MFAAVRRGGVSPITHSRSMSGGLAVPAAIDEAKKRLRPPAKQDALRLLRNYIVERWEMVEYPAALAKGWDPGAPGLRTRRRPCAGTSPSVSNARA